MDYFWQRGHFEEKTTFYLSYEYNTSTSVNILSMSMLRVCISVEPNLWENVKRLAQEQYLSTSAYLRLILKKQLESGENGANME